MEFGIKDKVALVTGSSRGIGKSIATQLASEGATVVICARNEDELKEAANHIKMETGQDVISIRMNLSIREDIEHLVQCTQNKFNRIDILVNNTGGPPSLNFLETNEMNWREAVNLLLMNVVHLCHLIIPGMKHRKWGRIINMASFSAKQPIENLVLSNTIRSGILGLTKSLSNELAEFGVLVNAVCPGWTLTTRVEELMNVKAQRTGKHYDDVIGELADTIPLKRLAKPEEIANLVTFLSSEKASYITGNTIQVDGGYIKSIF
jgi:3-oxoacyl-[acyl-carrier protein] reductase